jgi:DNA-binding response OmpR family regulator
MEYKSTPGPHRAGDLSLRKRLLLTEDDDDIRIVFEMVLKDYFDIRSASTAAQAVDLARSFRPDVVLLDWTLPDATGEDLVHRLRAIEAAFAQLPIVVVSGVPTLAAIAASVGAVPCPKPCEVDQLLAAIERALSIAARP